MLYDRKIKYLDYFENGERISGGGFAKFEVRNGVFLLQLHVKGLHGTDSFFRDVTILTERGESVLGQMELKKGCGDFYYEGSLEGGIGQIRADYEELWGIKVPISSIREVRCVWKREAGGTGSGGKMSGVPESAREPGEKKEPDSRGNFREQTQKVDEITEELSGRMTEAGNGQSHRRAGKQPEQGDQKGRSERSEQREQKGWPEQGDQKGWSERSDQRERAGRSEQGDQKGWLGRPEQPEQKGWSERPEQSEQSERKEVSLPEAVVMTEEKKQEINGRSGLGDSRPVGNSRNPGEELRMAGRGKAPRPIKLMEDKWLQLSAIYPHVQPFKDERDYLSIRPGDFVLLSSGSYQAANNSFLLHGYYNYHHLILNRMEKRGEVTYYLGVPGNYYAKEKQVAVMFGFESFESAQEPAQTGDFGYYMMRVEL